MTVHLPVVSLKKEGRVEQNEVLVSLNQGRLIFTNRCQMCFNFLDIFSVDGS
jgi:hypothetical protein